MKSGLGDRQAQAKETFDLIVRYLKQETLSPLKSLGKFAAYAVSGSFVSAFGFLLVLLGVLRLLQDETGSTFHGHLSWIPYLVTSVVGLVALGLCFVVLLKRRAKPSHT